ncbi:MAG: hypothetical protein AseanaTS_15460 [Candidatus Pelagadaptatus aseana]|uniref:hypothetical protein n=1 Tax=Candidatus Pelagadaptatus aseana TaxID=3120508 RepID=UPI0039B1A916
MNKVPPNRDDDGQSKFLNDLNLSARIKLIRILSVFGFSVMGVFGVNAIIEQHYPLGLGLLLMTLLGVISNLVFQSDKDYTKAINIIAACMIVLGCMLVFTGSIDGTALYWVPPHSGHDHLCHLIYHRCRTRLCFYDSDYRKSGIRCTLGDL